MIVMAARFDRGALVLQYACRWLRPVLKGQLVTREAGRGNWQSRSPRAQELEVLVNKFVRPYQRTMNGSTFQPPRIYAL